MAYQPFLIAPFGTGLDTDMSPWLLPQDAFSDIVNGHIHHGVIEKREGYTKYGDIVHQDQTNWKISGVSKATTGVVTVVSTAGIVAGNIVEIRNVDGMTELNGNQYTVGTVSGGTMFQLLNVDTTDFTAYSGSAGDVYLIAQDRVMGLERYIPEDNEKEVIAFDTKRACKYNTSTGVFDPLDSADIMSGSDTDYIWADNWASTESSSATTLYRIYFTNGKALDGGLDGIRYYDGGTTTTSFAPTFNTSYTISGCKLIFAFKKRLMILNTFETTGSTTTNYPQRIRWSIENDPDLIDGWDDSVRGKGGFLDVPTGDQIISAQPLQDSLLIFFTDSIWSFRPTPDPKEPYKIYKINDFRACGGKMTTEQFDRHVVSSGLRGIVGTDGVESRRFDERIEDFTQNEVRASKFDKVFAKRSFYSRRLWMLYPKSSDDADSALIFDEESSAFSKYDIDLNVLGYGGAEQDQGIDGFGGATIKSFGTAVLSDYYFDEGAEVFIGGNRSGRVFITEKGSGDAVDLFTATIVDATKANPGVVTISTDSVLSNGDVVNISGIATGSMVELNGREFTVSAKSGNSFTLKGVDASTFSAYVAGSGGTVSFTDTTSIDFSLTSAAWNPWMSEGKKSQLGYVDLFLDTHRTAKLTVHFYTDNNISPATTEGSTINLLPPLRELSTISGVTNANPGNVTAGEHGLSTGDKIYIYGVKGISELNDVQYTVTVVDEGNFTIGVDTSNYGVYTNDGLITELPYSSEKTWKRVYYGGIGYQHKVRITSKGSDDDIKIHAFIPWFRPSSVRPI